MNDDESVLSDPPLHDEPMPAHMQIDGAADHVEHHGQPQHSDQPEHPDHPDHADQHGFVQEEPNLKKRKRYNDPPMGNYAFLTLPSMKYDD
jgi:hypothetical protein